MKTGAKLGPVTEPVPWETYSLRLGTTQVQLCRVCREAWIRDSNRSQRFLRAKVEGCNPISPGYGGPQSSALCSPRLPPDARSFLSQPTPVGTHPAPVMRQRFPGRTLRRRSQAAGKRQCLQAMRRLNFRSYHPSRFSSGHFSTRRKLHCSRGDNGGCLQP